MKDEKIARILAAKFNDLARQEEKVKRSLRGVWLKEDEEVLYRIRGNKMILCETMDLLGVNGLIDFEHKVRASLAAENTGKSKEVR